ncbi:MAG TPA: M56 family metallopeptidase [Thermomicrobiales bacterium]|nr:M56 family metallopeptidase [Thermomicrobiales bacterium]
MRGARLLDCCRRACPAFVAVLTAIGLSFPVLVPPVLLPIARAYRALCEHYPILALVTFHTSAPSMALLLTLLGLALGAGVGAGGARTISSVHFNLRLHRAGEASPPRLAQAATNLGIDGRVTFIPAATPAAFCYGFFRPRIAITGGIVARLDEGALTAVLAHERHHLRRRDPLRYLALHVLAASTFILPMMPALRDRWQAQIELAADRAALAVTSPYDLAAALRLLLLTPQLMPAGVAGLTATEARIAQLTGEPRLPAIPIRLAIATGGVFVALGASMVALGASANLVPMLCRFCTGGG